MTLWDRLFGFPAVDQIFSAQETVQRMLDVEAALAAAEAGLGMIPARAADAIRAQCRAAAFDLDALAEEAGRAGNLAIPLVRQLTDRVATTDAEAARYVHWGATSQDIIDTGLVLQLRDALQVIEAGVAQLRHAALGNAERYRTSPAAARTWLQHASPTTLGLTFAGWADALGRHATRLDAVRREDLVLQLGGAAGTLAAFGGRGIEVAEMMGAALGLPVPATPWHGHRDRLAAVATTVALLTGTLGKIARDVALAGQTEVGELAEPSAPGRGGSSTMPHKRNPIGAAVALAAAIRVPALTGAILAGMVQEQERGLGGWQAEWETLPELLRLAGGSVYHLATVVEGLHVDADRARENLEATRGLVYSEALSQALTAAVGRAQSGALISKASQHTRDSDGHLRDVVGSDKSIMAHLAPKDVGRIFDPVPQIDAAAKLVDRVLDAVRAAPGTPDG